MTYQKYYLRTKAIILLLAFPFLSSRAFNPIESAL
jgi:hypothetical protein